MELKPELLQTMTNLGVTDTELEILRGRMLSVVSSLEAQLNALNAQINTLAAQRDDVQSELNQAKQTVRKLVEGV